MLATVVQRGVKRGAVALEEAAGGAFSNLVDELTGTPEGEPQEARARVAAGGAPPVLGMAHQRRYPFAPQRLHYNKLSPFAPFLSVTHYATETGTLENAILTGGIQACDVHRFSCNDFIAPFGTSRPRMRWTNSPVFKGMYSGALVTSARIKITVINDQVGTDGTDFRVTDHDKNTYIYLKLNAGLNEDNFADGVSSNKWDLISPFNEGGGGMGNNNGSYPPDNSHDGHFNWADPIEPTSLADGARVGKTFDEVVQYEDNIIRKRQSKNRPVTVSGKWSLQGHEGINPMEYISAHMVDPNDQRNFDPSSLTLGKYHHSSPTTLNWVSPSQVPSWLLFQNVHDQNAVNVDRYEFKAELELDVLYFGIRDKFLNSIAE